MKIPIPFVGWINVDEEDTVEMLREQLQIQQREIERLNKELFAAQVLALKRYTYDPDEGDDVWFIEKKKRNEVIK